MSEHVHLHISNIKGEINYSGTSVWEWWQWVWHIVLGTPFLVSVDLVVPPDVERHLRDLLNERAVEREKEAILEGNHERPADTQG